MIKKLNIKCNLDEARVLLASADAVKISINNQIILKELNLFKKKDSDGQMNMDEFLELIFNDNPGLNVNLSDIPALSKEEMDKLMDTSAANVF